MEISNQILAFLFSIGISVLITSAHKNGIKDQIAQNITQMKSKLKEEYPYLVNESSHWKYKVAAESTLLDSGIGLLEHFLRSHDTSVDNFSKAVKSKQAAHNNSKRFIKLLGEIANLQAKWSLVVSSLNEIKSKRNTYLKGFLFTVENLKKFKGVSKDKMEDNSKKILKNTEMKYQNEIVAELKKLQEEVLNPLFKVDKQLNSLSGGDTEKKIDFFVIKNTNVTVKYYCKKFRNDFVQ